MTRLITLLAITLTSSMALAKPSLTADLSGQLEDAIRQHCRLTHEATIRVDELRVSNEAVLSNASTLRRIELPKGEDGVGRVAARALLVSDNGSESWTWVHARVETRVPTLVASGPLKRGDVLDSKHLRRALRPVHPNGSATLEELVGKSLTRAIREGDAVRGHMVRSTPAITRGDVVDAELRGARFVVKTTAEATQRGHIGDVIRVRILPHRRVARARIIGRGIVEVLR